MSCSDYSDSDSCSGSSSSSDIESILSSSSRSNKKHDSKLRGRRARNSTFGYKEAAGKETDIIVNDRCDALSSHCKDIDCSFDWTTINRKKCALSPVEKKVESPGYLSLTKSRQSSASPHFPPTPSNSNGQASSPRRRRLRAGTLDNSLLLSNGYRDDPDTNKLHLAGRRVMAMPDTIKKVQQMRMIPLVPITISMQEAASKVQTHTIDEAAEISAQRQRMLYGKAQSKSQPASPMCRSNAPSSTYSEYATRLNRSDLLQDIAHNYIISQGEEERAKPHFARRTLSHAIATARHVDH